MATQSRTNNPHVMLAPSTPPMLSLWGGAMRCHRVLWRELQLAATASAVGRQAFSRVSTPALPH